MSYEDRKRIQCRPCGLTQFVRESKECLRCHKSYKEPAKPVPAPEPVKPKPVVISADSVEVRDVEFWIAFVLWDLRQKQGKSQSEVANRMGVPRTYISRIETGKGAPALPSIVRLSNALNVAPSYVVRMTEFLTFGN